MLYEIHTINMMFTINATYFKANQDGVMFFDEQDNGIAFVPNVSLNLVRVNPKAKEADMIAMRQQFNNWMKND